MSPSAQEGAVAGGSGDADAFDGLRRGVGALLVEDDEVGFPGGDRRWPGMSA